MSRQSQVPGYYSGHYQTPYPNPSGSQQHGHSAQLSSPNTQDTYKDHSSQHAYSPHPEGALVQYQPSERRHPYARTAHFPEPPGSSTNHPERGRQGSYDYYRSIGSSSDGHQFHYSEARLSRSAGNYSNPYSQSLQGRGHNVPGTQPHDRGAIGYDEGLQGHDPRTAAPVSPPVGGHSPGCRYPGCNNPVLFNKRVNRPSEWCGDEHMQSAIVSGLESPCRECRVWPRWRGYGYCGGDICIYPEKGEENKVTSQSAQEHGEREERSTRHAGGIAARVGMRSFGIGGFYEWSDSRNTRRE